MIPLPVFGGLCHAPHVHSNSDTKKIVHGKLATLRTELKVQLPLYSTSSGQPYAAEDAAGLFSDVVTELLTKAICWDSVIDGFVNRVRGASVSAIVISSFGKSIPLKDLTTGLSHSVPETEVSTESFTAWAFAHRDADAPPRSPAQAKLAIVGMACRLPGGATVSVITDV